jgi:hypothetical protein
MSGPGLEGCSIYPGLSDGALCSVLGIVQENDQQDPLEGHGAYSERRIIGEKVEQRSNGIQDSR